MLNEKKTDWIRVSNRTGFEIPLPSNAKVTYDYISPGEYIGKFIFVYFLQ